MVKDIMHQDFIETTVNFPKLIGSTGYLIKILYSRFLIQMCEKKVMCIFTVLPKKITKTRTNYRNSKPCPIKAGFLFYNSTLGFSELKFIDAYYFYYATSFVIV